MALKASKNAPKWPPKAPTWAPRGPRWPLGRPLWARDGSKRAFLIPKIAFMILAMAPRWPLSCAPLSQDGLHETQDSSCDVLHCPKTAFIKLTMVVDGPKMPYDPQGGLQESQENGLSRGLSSHILGQQYLQEGLHDPKMAFMIREMSPRCPCDAGAQTNASS